MNLKVFLISRYKRLRHILSLTILIELIEAVDSRELIAIDVRDKAADTRATKEREGRLAEAEGGL
jgi:hypothetical protein